MSPLRPLLRRAVSVLLPIALTATAGMGAVEAAETGVSRTWVGQDGGAWSDPSNWSPSGIPDDGDALSFSTPVVSVDDLDGLVVSSLTFTASHRISGTTTLGLDGGVTVPRGWPQIDSPLSLSLGSHLFDMNGLISLNGVVSGAGGVVKAGAGHVFLMSANTYLGPTTVTAGTLYATTGGLGDPAQGTSVLAGATLATNEQSAEPLALTGSTGDEGGLAVSPMDDGVFAAPITLQGGRVRVAPNGTATMWFTGAISGPGGLRLDNGSAFVLAGDNSYAGGTEIRRGVVIAGSDTALGIGPVSVPPEGMLLLSGDRRIDNALTLSGNGGGAGALGVISGHAEVRGPVAVSGNTEINGNDGDDASSLLVSGPVSGSGWLLIRGDVVLSGSGSAFDGSTFVMWDTLVLDGPPGGATVPGSLGVAQDPRYAPWNAPALAVLGADEQIGDDQSLSISEFGTFDANGYNETVGFLASEGTLLLGIPDVAHSVLSTTGGAWFFGGVVVFSLSDAGSDRIEVTGTVQLGGALALDATAAPGPGEEVVLIDNDGDDPVEGIFDSLPEGTMLDVAGVSVVITYKGGTGNDVTLIAEEDYDDAGDPPLPVGPRSGYWMLGKAGQVWAFGDAPNLAGPGAAFGESVDLEPLADGRDGYWVLNSQGGVAAAGAAPHLPGLAAGQLRPGERTSAISATPSGAGYWIFTSQGRVFPFGDAEFFGDMTGVTLNGPVLDSIATPSGAGYYMVGSDGGIFAFGDAQFRGSMGDHRLNAPVQSLVPDPNSGGYWLVASDGGIFAFGGAPFLGSMATTRLNRSVTGMIAFGDGYLMVGEDGGIFNFSGRPFHGSLGGQPPSEPIVAVAALT